MRPDLSLVLLLVLSGAGQGVFIFLVIFDLLSQLTGGLPSYIFYTLGAASALLSIVGMTASMTHLGNPQRGYKAILKWKSSWLSREALSMGAFISSLILYLAAYALALSTDSRLIIGFVGILSAFALYLSSAMLYVKIRFIKEWSNEFTVINFMLFGVTSGGAVIYAIFSAFNLNSQLFINFLIFLTIVSMASKTLTYIFNSSIYTPYNTKHALNINSANINLISTGTSYEHYNTKEYSFNISPQSVKIQQTAVFLLAFILPLCIWIFYAMSSKLPNPLLAIAAMASMFAGLVIERKLFFIQGNHLQNIYYSNFKNNNMPNPILSRQK